MRTVHTRLTRVVCLVYFFLLTFKFDDAPASHDIDPSWSAVASWAWTNGYQWGRDIIFSYGPYAFLSPRISFDANIFHTAVVAQILYGALIVLIAAAALKAGQRLMTGMLFATVVAYSVWVAGDALWLMSYALSLLALLTYASPTRGLKEVVALAAGIVVAIPWLVKFTSIPLALIWAGCVLVAPISARLRAIALTSFGLTAAGLWIGSGGDFPSLAQFIDSSSEIALGYGSAMQKPSSSLLADALGLVLLAAVLISILGYPSNFRTLDRKRIAWTIMLCATILLAFKASYTRIDEDHIMIFFPVACSAAALSLAISETTTKSNKISVIVVFIISIVATISTPEISNLQKIGLTGIASISRIIDNSEELISPGSVFEKNALERESFSRMFDFPITRKLASEQTVDIVPVSQGIVFLNRLNYHPRPVFQSYAAFTKDLTERNAAFLRSSDAPQWIMLRWAAIDKRLPSSEDPASLREIFRRYQLETKERDFLIFRRKAIPDTENSVGEVRTKTHAHMNELITLPDHDDTLSMSFTVLPTIAAKLATLILREPRFYMRVVTRDGKEHSFRLVRNITSTGLLISPLLLTNTDVERWLGGGGGNYVSSIEFVPETAFGFAAFESAVDIEWNRGSNSTKLAQFGQQ